MAECSQIANAQVTEGQPIIILHSTLSEERGMNVLVCLPMFCRVCDLLLWTGDEKPSEEDDPPLFSEESKGYLSKGVLSVI